jgi:hypothetical protein
MQEREGLRWWKVETVGVRGGEASGGGCEARKAVQAWRFKSGLRISG